MIQNWHTQRCRWFYRWFLCRGHIFLFYANKMHHTNDKCKKQDFGIYCAHMLQRNVNYSISWPFSITFNFFFLLCFTLVIHEIFFGVDDAFTYAFYMSYVMYHISPYTLLHQTNVFCWYHVLLCVYACMCVCVRIFLQSGFFLSRCSYAYISLSHSFCALHLNSAYAIAFIVEFVSSVAEAHELFETNQIRQGCRSDRLHFYSTPCSFFSCGLDCLLH